MTDDIIESHSWDVTEDAWRSLNEDQRSDLREWARRHDVDPNVTARIDVLLLDCPALRVWGYGTDHDGKISWNEAVGDVVRLPPRLVLQRFDVPLSVR